MRDLATRETPQDPPDSSDELRLEATPQEQRGGPAEVIQQQRDKIYKAMDFVNVVYESLNPDEECSRRTVLDTAYDLLKEAAGALASAPS